MGNLQAFLLDPGAVVQQEVEVEGPRPLRRDGRPIAPEAALDLEQEAEEPPWRQPRLEDGDSVQEARLIHEADGDRIPQRGDGDDLDIRVGGERSDRPTQRLLAVAEVRAVAYICPCH